MKKRLEALKKNKKGFSLIELIIVIAIMAILIGIVASQVIPYMEKSRRSKDQQQLATVSTAMVSAIAQCDQNVAAFSCQLKDLKGSGGNAEVANNVAPLLENEKTGDDMATIENDIADKFKSKKYTENKAITVVYDPENEVTVEGTTYPKGAVVVYVGDGKDTSQVASSDSQKNAE